MHTTFMESIINKKKGCIQNTEDLSNLLSQNNLRVGFWLECLLVFVFFYPHNIVSFQPLKGKQLFRKIFSFSFVELQPFSMAFIMLLTFIFKRLPGSLQCYNFQVGDIKIRHLFGKLIWQEVFKFYVWIFRRSCWRGSYDMNKTCLGSNWAARIMSSMDWISRITQ